MTQEGEWTPDAILEEDTHESVTRKRLVGTERHMLLRPFQRLGWTRGWLHETPYFEYLDVGEVPEFLFSVTSPIEIQEMTEIREVSPDGRYIALAGLTPRRVLVAVGQSPENETLELDYDNIRSFSITPRGTLEVEYKSAGTDARREPAEPSAPIAISFETDTSRMNIELNKKCSVSMILDHLGPFIINKTKLDGWTGKTEWEEARERYERETDQYREWEQATKQLARQADHDSVTESIVREHWDSLKPGEQPHFYTTGAEHRHHVLGASGSGPSDVFEHEWTMFTDRRILIQDETEFWKIANDLIETFSINERKREEENDDGTVETKTTLQLDVETSDEYHIIDVNSLSQRDVSDLLGHLRQTVDSS